MPYSCQYVEENGIKCSRWLVDGAIYCIKHANDLRRVDELEREVNELIRNRGQKE